MSELVIKLDLDTLRGLFGGDDPPAIEFRNAIADKFANQYLKSLINSTVAQRRDELVRAEIDRTIKETVLDDTKMVMSSQREFQAHYKNLIDITVDNEVTNLISTKVEAANKTITLTEQVAQKQIVKLRDTVIIDAVNAALNDKRIKELVSMLVEKHIEDFAREMLSATLSKSKSGQNGGS